MSDVKTEYEFTLPKGYLDPKTGETHKQGTMRLVTAEDEILPMKDLRVKDNPAHMAMIILARVVTRLGNLDMIDASVLELLFPEDFDALVKMFNEINDRGSGPRQGKPLG